jgi:hypothetical protein
LTGEVILYQTEDGATQISLREMGGTVWLTQTEMAALFDTSKQNISLHLRNIFADGELVADSVVKESLIPAADGKTYATLTYNLDAILAVGFRVRSRRGVQFRRWASTVLQEYLVKGFAMDDAKLKAAEQWDYFDEWLARIRDIRASEKRFYQKVKDLFTTAVDYDKASDAAQLFFQKVQNKMLWAVAGQTAAEIIAARANPAAQNMGLTSWKGGIVRKGDVGTSKNYLGAEEVDELNRIVTMYLDFAEDQARRRAPVTMAMWAEKLDGFLKFNDREVLTHAGKLRMDVAQQLATDRFAVFDAARKQADAAQADTDDLAAIEALAKDLSRDRGKA